MKKDVICIRGAGDLATGVIQKFYRSGFPVYATEVGQPTAIRRQVALSTAMVKGEYTVEDVTARRVEFTMEALAGCWQDDVVPIICDPQADSVGKVRPAAVIDAILAKKNYGTHREMAPVTIALGPGFRAPDDVQVIIETMRGHHLGRLIENGEAIPNTGTPGELGGQSTLRVIHAAQAGVIRHLSEIGDNVQKGQPLFEVGETIMRAPFTGMLRGLIAEGMMVKKGMKVADIDPRELSRDECFTISDKARCLGGAALEAYLYMRNKLF